MHAEGRVVTDDIIAKGLHARPMLQVFVEPETEGNRHDRLSHDSSARHQLLEWVWLATNWMDLPPMASVTSL